MAIHFGNEHLLLKSWDRGVYKIIINEKWFYIGSSIDLKRRLSGWKHTIYHGKNISKNGNLKFIHPDITKVRFEVLERVDDATNPKTVEDKYIKAEFLNPDCLNISATAFSPTKDKKPYGYIPKPKKVKTIKYISYPKPVGAFNKTGECVKVYTSIREAVRGTGCCDTNINKILKGKCGRYKGLLFKSINPDGTFIEPPIYIPKPPNRFKQPSRPVYKYSIAGYLLCKYESVKEAAKEVGCSKNLIFYVAGNKLKQNGTRHLTAKGFKWKYY